MTTRQKISTVMTVDDERVDQLLCKRILKRSALVENILSFRMAEEALEYLKSEDREPVDVIFLDINMPRMSGFEFLEAAVAQLGAEFTQSFVIMLTTSLNPEDEKRARQFSMVKDYLRKPITIEDVFQVATQLHGVD